LLFCSLLKFCCFIVAYGETEKSIAQEVPATSPGYRDEQVAHANSAAQELGELAQKHMAFYNIGFLEAKAKAMSKQKLARKWARGWATQFLDRLTLNA